MSSIVGSYLEIFLEVREYIETGVDEFRVRFYAKDLEVLFMRGWVSGGV